MRVVDWLFRDRQTGALTVAQFPNWSLATWMVATLVGWVVSPHGAIGRGTRVVGVVALLVWAVDEVVRGVNPFRRILGAVVAVVVLVGVLS